MSSPLDGLNHDRKTAMPALVVSIEVVTTVLLFMRISSRFTLGPNLGADDVLIFLAWLTGLGLTVAVLLGTEKYGLNRHVWDVPLEYFSKGGLMGFIVEVLFFWSTCFTKVSVLMFYRRLVEGTVSQRFRVALWAAIAVVIAYTIAFFVLIIIACNPVRAIWMQFDLDWRASHDFHCKPAKTQVLVAKLVGSLSVVTDFYSVVLPAFLVLQIRVGPRQKIGLFFIFGLGMLVVGAGIVRTYYLSRVFSEAIDKTWWTWNVFLASLIECNVAIICACAPSVKALFGRHFRNASSRYESGSENTPNSYTKGSYGAGSEASEAGQQLRPAQSRLDTELQLRGKSSSGSAHNMIDSAYTRAPLKPAHIVHSIRTDRDDDEDELSVTTTGTPGLPRAQTFSRSASSKVLLPPATRSRHEKRASSSPQTSKSTDADDEIALVSNARYDEQTETSIEHASIARPTSFRLPPENEIRRVAARSPSPTALSHQDAVVPASMLSPRIRHRLELARIERTKFPAI